MEDELAILQEEFDEFVESRFGKKYQEWNIKQINAKKRKIVLSIMITVCTMFCLCGCSQKEPSVVRTYEKTDSKEAFENTEPVIMVKHYEMSDGTWKTDDYTYQYRLEITGRMNNAEKDSTFIFLSNIENITFDQAWKAAGFSSNMDDYFDVEVAKFVGMK